MLLGIGDQSMSFVKGLSRIKRKWNPPDKNGGPPIKTDRREQATRSYSAGSDHGIGQR
jgi:hypothetical protein